MVKFKRKFRYQRVKRLFLYNRGAACLLCGTRCVLI